MQINVLALGTASALLALSSAQAATFASESFESPVLNPGAIQYSAGEDSYNTNATGPATVTGFSFSGFSGITSNGNGYVLNTPFGSQEAFLQSYPDAGSEIDWNLTGLTSGKLYTLSFYDIAYYVGAENFKVSAFGSSADYTPASNSSYALNTFSFTPTTSSGDISFVAQSSGGNFVSGIDNLSISSVPEPASWVVMLAGLFGLGAMLRNSPRKQSHPIPGT
jgi:hypothetical protein